jgi:hypothetical protein
MGTNRSSELDEIFVRFKALAAQENEYHQSGLEALASATARPDAEHISS